MRSFLKLNVLTRLIIGFSALFIVTTSVSFYSILKLKQFNGASVYMLEAGDKMLEYKDRLTDALLSEVSYEKKFVISKEDPLYDRFVGAGKEFAQSLREAAGIANTLGSKEILDNIAKRHARYVALIEEERGYIRSGKPYPFSWYKAEKEIVVDAMIKEIKRLELHIAENTKTGIEGLARSGTGAMRTAFTMALFSLLFGVIIAGGITRSITRPLSIIKKKTREIARGKFENPLMLSSPPEIEELANALNMMSKQLAETEKVKSDFFALMTHELRTPLASMKGGITLLQKHSDRAEHEKQKILTIMSEECNRLIQQVNSLLDLSKMEAGIIDLDIAFHDIKPLLKKAVAEIEPLSASRSIFFEFDYSGKISPVRMDPERLLQVVRNILGNAVKYSPNGCKIKISLKPASEGLEFSVTDSGPGIAKEDRAAIFDKYRQAETAVQTRIKGTGLGLALAKHIVDAHGGKIWVESEPGKGSTFTVFLPD
ncbi:MAG: integral rane sensor signal transduction histidine kinase [Deltaproteobacteria bacterium]|nr:integral rane sensor signal transduction histidine kinase [Deltaproteobacteria bacterium]